MYRDQEDLVQGQLGQKVSNREGADGERCWEQGNSGNYRSNRNCTTIHPVMIHPKKII
jgi:hypothetical protein